MVPLHLPFQYFASPPSEPLAGPAPARGGDEPARGLPVREHERQPVSAPRLPCAAVRAPEPVRGFERSHPMRLFVRIAVVPPVRGAAAFRAIARGPPLSSFSLEAPGTTSTVRCTLGKPGHKPSRVRGHG